MILRVASREQASKIITRSAAMGSLSLQHLLADMQKLVVSNTDSEQSSATVLWEVAFDAYQKAPLVLVCVTRADLMAAGFLLGQADELLRGIFLCSGVHACNSSCACACLLVFQNVQEKFTNRC